MIFVPKVFRPEIEVVSRSNLQGFYKFEVLKVDSNGNPIEKSRRVLADWFPNLILDQGLNYIGTLSDWMAAVQVGTGSTAPAASQTSLVSYAFGTTNISTNTLIGESTTPPYYTGRIKVFRFNAGTATGIFSEVGIGRTAATGSLFSRALILDGGGSPTTITVLSDEVLDVSYQIRNYATETDQVGNVTITGVGTLNFTLRASNAGSPAFSQLGINGAIGGVGISGSDHTSYTGAIGVATGTPSGTAVGNGSSSNSAYSNNSYQRSGTVVWGLSNGTSTINSIRILLGTSATAGFARVQIGFSAGIPKTGSNVFNFNCTHSWARRP